LVTLLFLDGEEGLTTTNIRSSKLRRFLVARFVVTRS
jgi:hypothetical protein